MKWFVLALFLAGCAHGALPGDAYQAALHQCLEESADPGMACGLTPDGEICCVWSHEHVLQVKCQNSVSTPNMEKITWL